MVRIFFDLSIKKFIVLNIQIRHECRAQIKDFDKADFGIFKDTQEANKFINLVLLCDEKKNETYLQDVKAHFFFLLNFVIIFFELDYK